MRVLLADLKSDRGFVSKDTVVGGYGSRLMPFSRVTSVIAYLKQQFHDVPSVHMAYIAAILSRAGHEVVWTRGSDADATVRADLALVLSSIVDHRHETAWADSLRARGIKVGFIGITASKMPELFADHCDFILNGEPEAGVMRIAQGQIPAGNVMSEQINDLDALPFPRWDLVTEDRVRKFGIRWSSRPVGGGYPLLASRGCPEFCTYCPHRILAGYRARSIANIVDEIERLCDQVRRPYVIFRDPLFSEQRDRCIELCDEIEARGLNFTFEAETRLDRLDVELLDRLYRAGFRAMSFGVESLDPATLKKSGRRPIPQAHQREIIAHCRKLGIVTAGFYVLGFLQDTWTSIAATIDYATDLGSTLAQFKILTPYPGTPMFKHPNLTAHELKYLLGTAYKRFYMRPSYLANFLKIQNVSVREWVARMDERVKERHAREEIADIARSVAC